ncbi:DNA methyltransferase [Micromonospora sp. FIMYZ51]|uniref:Eco57I restriction-modification methylase domain-containing protein n=1 Tax=Micromonospora sp. FIMYZ51 TaxID=3051832 RepID=UPI00311F6A8A
MASLFSRNRLRDAAKLISNEQIQEHLAIVRTWRDDYHRGSLKKDKETSREQAYNQDFFMRILGYREKPATPYTFEPKATTLKHQLPDAVLGYTDASTQTENIAAVLELKGASVALDRPQRREGNMSPVQQGFKYKTQYRRCPFVIVSNFYELRLYNDNQLDFELWTLDDLLEPANDYLNFKSFYTLLHANNLTSRQGPSKTEDLLIDIRVEQENIGKQFFEEYRTTRLELLRDIYRNNPPVRANFGIGIEKGQKILDRIVFACFAEDAGLLPDNIIERVVTHADQSAFDETLWSAFTRFFDAVDVGSPRLGIPQGYNGGLFAADKVLNALRISDETMRRVTRLSRYDFSEHLSVNILGHIFEQSISDLEEIRSKVSQAATGEALVDLQRDSARKGGGIYYTPEYIVRYIVDNTVGLYLREAEERLKEKHGLKGSIQEATYARRERQAYLEYQSVLQKIRILDPACGSGAFLVYAFDYLLAENRRVDAILGGDLLGTEDYVRFILRNNLFGVDLNDESVEITKLSLWLKTARRGQQLTSLDENIRCGNSLIADPALAGRKAFDWEAEFPDAFKSGGFDVVVGNPPYVSALELSRHLSSEEKKYLKKNYRTSVGTVDLYIYFFEKALTVIKDGGKMAYISPNRFLSASYGRALREWLVSTFKISQLIDYSDKRVFEDASTYPVIAFIDAVRPDSHYVVRSGKIDEETKLPELYEMESSKLSLLNDTILGFLLNDKLPLTEKVFNACVPLTIAGKINATSTAAEADDFAALIGEVTGFKLINTGTIDPFSNHWGLRPFKKQGKQFLKPRLPADAALLGQGRMDLYRSPKIIVSKIGLTCEAFYDSGGDYASIDTNCIHSFADDFAPEYILCWLNSTLYNYVFECLFDGLRMAGGYLLYSAPNLRNTPIKRITLDEQARFVDAARRLQELYQALNETNDRVRTLLTVGLQASKLPTRLGSWWRLDFPEFVKSLKVKVSFEQSEQLLALFQKYAPRLTGLEDDIKQIRDAVDFWFYEIFELTAAEVAELRKATSVQNLSAEPAG